MKTRYTFGAMVLVTVVVLVVTHSVRDAIAQPKYERGSDTNVLQVSFVLAKPDFMVGEPIECVLLLKNKTNHEVWVSMVLPPNDIQMEVITSPKGAGLREAYTMLGGNCRNLRLKPGEVTRWAFLLNPFVWFTKPGKYALRLRDSILYREKEEGKNCSYLYPDQTVTLDCHAMNPQKFHDMMRGLVEKTLHGQGREQSSSVYALSVIGLPETLPYLKECLVGSDYKLGNDLAYGLADIGGDEAAAEIKRIIAKAKDDFSRRLAENALWRLRNRPELSRPSP